MALPRIYPLPFMLALLALMLLLSALFPGGPAFGVTVGVVGVIVLGAGVALIAVAAGLFRRRQTTLNPHGESAALVQDGLYRYSRNPMYLGMLLVLAGVALWLGHVAALVVPPVFVWVVSSQNIRREEQMLEARFGDAYRAYRQRVRRWI